MRLMAKDLPLLQHRPWRVFPWGKLQATLLDLLLLQWWLVCESASLLAKPQVTPPVKTMWRFLLPELSSRFSYAPAFWLALPQAIRPD